jgi:hypothetical protein
MKTLIGQRVALDLPVVPEKKTRAPQRWLFQRSANASARLSNAGGWKRWFQAWSGDRHHQEHRGTSNSS